MKHPMKVDATKAGPLDTLRFTASSWVVLGVAMVLVVIFWTFIGVHAAGPSDGARFMWGAPAFRPNGVEVAPLKDEAGGFRNGDVVVAIEGRPLESWIRDRSAPWTARSRWDVGQTVTYTVERDGGTLDLRFALGKYPLGAILARSWGVFTAVLLLTVVSSFVFFRRPGDPAARVLLLFSAAGACSAVWVLGLEPIDLTLGSEFWIFSATNFFAYTFIWITLVHFWLVFPVPANLVQHNAWVVPALYLLPFAIIIGVVAAMWPAASGPLDWLARSGQVHVLFPVVYIVLALAVMVWRYRTSLDPISRRQVRWVIFAFGVFFILLVALGNLPEIMLGKPLISWNAQSLLFLPVPFAMAIGILKYRLFDIETKVNRTLVYACLTALVVGIYVLIVGVAGVWFQTSDNLLLSVVAIGVVAVLFQPLRERLQGLVNRMIYGHRDDPYEVLSDLGQRLEITLAPDAMLRAVVETVAQALKAPYVAIAFGEGAEADVSVAYGEPTDEIVTLPLAYQGEAIGQMLLAPRAAGQPYSETDRRLLADIARQAGVVAHGVRLTDDLKRSRERLVTAREEERRRIRRDLHDGLGPVLAGIAMKMDAARNLLGTNPTAADQPLGDLKAQAQSAIADIRRLVYELRPPALDELGLVQAISEYATRLNGTDAGNDDRVGADMLVVSVNAPDKMPPLSAAVEVAAYRIAMEALTNVVRHAEAARCNVRFSNGKGDILELGITDDGVGIPAGFHAGVGITSMRERAEELGGTFVVEPMPDGGTRILTRLPLRYASPSPEQARTLP